MIRRPPRSNRTYTLFPSPTLFRSSAPYRSRAVIDPRGVLADFGTTLPDGVEIKVWDSTAEVRYLVLPLRPAGTESLRSEEHTSELQSLMRRSYAVFCLKKKTNVTPEL